MRYVEALRQALDDSMTEFENMLILGQGVWSPFYVGTSLEGLEAKFGRSRIIDTPVSENCVTGMALGAAISGSPTVVIHPRMDFMILAMDPIVNSAAKWRYSLNFKTPIPLTIRTIINRGGEQGAQHSQALHSWFAHIPGLRVVMPSSAKDAYQLLKQSISCPDPVVFIEDRWSYELEENFEINTKLPSLAKEGPNLVGIGKDLTVVGIGHTTNLAKTVSLELAKKNITFDLIDLRVLQPLNIDVLKESVRKTGKLLVIDGGWRNSGISAEIISSFCEVGMDLLTKPPARLTLPESPAPTSFKLEQEYYFTVRNISQRIMEIAQS